MLKPPLRLHSLGAVVLLPALVLVALCLASSAAGARTVSVLVKNDYYAAKTVTIARGDTVKWVWRSRGRKHDVASAAFGNSGFKRRGTFTVRFTNAGRYAYYCGLHEGMSGTVVVRR